MNILRFEFAKHKRTNRAVHHLVRLVNWEGFLQFYMMKYRHIHVPVAGHNKGFLRNRRGVHIINISAPIKLAKLHRFESVLFKAG